MVLTILQIIGQTTDLEIAEIAARSGANCGSLFLDLRFRELVKTVRRLVLLISSISHIVPAVGGSPCTPGSCFLDLFQ
jgi:hypothetical protein